VDVSSTAIRALIHKGSRCRYLVPYSVGQIIREETLY
jgi:nicotinic acid mononucleotide adenylyltransferase